MWNRECGIGNSWLLPRPHYARGILKGRFHSENSSDVFRSHCVGEIWKRNNRRPFWIILCLRKTRIGEYHDYLNVVKIISVLNEKPADLKIVFEKLCFRDGLLSMDSGPTRGNKSRVFKLLRFEKRFRTFCDRLMWTASLNIEIKLCFEILQGRGLWGLS